MLRGLGVTTYISVNNDPHGEGWRVGLRSKGRHTTLYYVNIML